MKKRPKLPMRSAKSHMVGWNMPHDEGRKSRWSEVTMITKRSNHMPMLTKIETTNMHEHAGAQPA